MYVARPLSEYIKNPDGLSLYPDGPNSGYMVIQDKDSETYSCFGLSKKTTMEYLPFAQNKALTLVAGDTTNDIILIPVLNLPLSSNRYYAIQPRGKNHKGKSFTCSRDEDMKTCCFCRCVKDIKPKPFDPRNVYQQFEICVHKASCARKGVFYAKSVAPDGHPPEFLREKGWSVFIKTPKKYKLNEAAGLNPLLRARQPDLCFPSTKRTSEAVVVGKWYTPFMFVKEGRLKDQVKKSPFYEVTLEQRWEQIYSCQNSSLGGKYVNLDVTVDLEMVHVAGNAAVWDDNSSTRAFDSAIWFWSSGIAGKEEKVGMAMELVQRMKWEQERGGCIGGREGRVSVKRSETFEGNGVWKEFGSYILVESFVFKRMDGSVVLTYDFKHTQHIRSIWDQ